MQHLRQTKHNLPIKQGINRHQLINHHQIKQTKQIINKIIKLIT